MQIYLQPPSFNFQQIISEEMMKYWYYIILHDLNLNLHFANISCLLTPFISILPYFFFCAVVYPSKSA